ncbi:hypothetical protein BH10ACI1_BH10ACI1_27170 [soil metagenome]
MCCEDENPADDYDDDCYDFDVIDEQIYVIEYYDYDVDDYWAQAWTMSEDGFIRFDSDYHNKREYRVFPTRYRLKDFKFTKSLRRVLNKNRDLKTIIRPFRPTEGKDDLLTLHKQIRQKSEQSRHSLRNSYKYLTFSNIKLMECCVFKGDKLVAFSTFEATERSMVGSLAFWDPAETSRSLGILTALLEIKYARDKGLEYYYLGNYIKQDPNYHYKTRFPALELWDWDNEKWVDFKDVRIAEMFNHKFRCNDDLDRNPEFAISLLEIFVQHHEDIVAAALFGSRAHGTAREDSDYDVMILTNNIEVFLNDNDWVTRFHRWRESKTETSGEIQIVRAFYKNGDEIEFNFASPEWANTQSIDEKTRRIVQDGMKILHDPHGILEKLQKAIA